MNAMMSRTLTPRFRTPMAPRLRALMIGLGGMLLLAGCAETQLAGAVMKEVSRSEVPSGQGGYWKVGNPYQIAGEWYYPKEDERYDRTGIASWYGPQFHKKMTANGEIFNMYQVSAAHPTLPMPVMARVTNLENGRQIIVRINDRGPFARGREIDMSMRAAELLGFKEQGTTKVRVQYLGKADGWTGEQGLQTAAAQPAPTPPPAAPVVAQAATQMQPVEDDDDTIATAGLPPAPGLPSAPVDLSLLAGGASAAGAAAGTVPAASAPSAPAAQTTAMAPVVDNFFVQAGSFRSASNANALASQLSDLGPVEVTESVVNGTPWYRVRVGPVNNAQGADGLLESVISRGQNGAKVVIN